MELRQIAIKVHIDMQKSLEKIEEKNKHARISRKH